jgi:hypothetical protein
MIVSSRFVTGTSPKLFDAGHPIRAGIAGAFLAAALVTAANAGNSFFEKHADVDRGGVVYAMTNASAGNKILVFARDRTGRLDALPSATAPTGGRGASDNAAIDPLGSQNRYRYTRTGRLDLDQAVAASVAGAPTDLALAAGGGFLYAIDAAGGAIDGFRVDPRNGELIPVETQPGLPAAAGIQGIATYDF